MAIANLTSGNTTSKIRDFAIGGGTRKIIVDGPWGAATAVKLQLQTPYGDWWDTGDELTSTKKAGVYDLIMGVYRLEVVGADGTTDLAVRYSD